jgi:peptidyl-dipeptidase Dcp
METKINLNEISIRTELNPGDIGYITYLHGYLYNKEYNYGITFETYVAKGLVEFYNNYDPKKDKVWICEYIGKIVGFLLLMHRENNSAQLRYFLLEPDFRKVGLGKKLMQLFMDFFYNRNYESCYLWTTNELYAAASLYIRHGFKLTEEKESIAFGKPLKEQRYDIRLK